MVSKGGAYKFTTEKQVLEVFSLQIACNYDDENSGSVAIRQALFYKTSISSAYTHYCLNK
jgi:hypothetical protein